MLGLRNGAFADDDLLTYDGAFRHDDALAHERNADRFVVGTDRDVAVGVVLRACELWRAALHVELLANQRHVDVFLLLDDVLSDRGFADAFLAFVDLQALRAQLQAAFVVDRFASRVSLASAAPSNPSPAMTWPPRRSTIAAAASGWFEPSTVSTTLPVGKSLRWVDLFVAPTKRADGIMVLGGATFEHRCDAMPIDIKMQ